MEFKTERELNESIGTKIGWTIFVLIFLYFDFNIISYINPFENGFLRLLIRVLLIIMVFILIPVYSSKILKAKIEQYYLKGDIEKPSFYIEDPRYKEELMKRYNRHLCLIRILLRLNAFMFLLRGVMLYILDEPHMHINQSDEYIVVEGYDGFVLLAMISAGLFALFLSFSKLYHNKKIYNF